MHGSAREFLTPSVSVSEAKDKPGATSFGSVINLFGRGRAAKRRTCFQMFLAGLAAGGFQAVGSVASGVRLTSSMVSITCRTIFGCSIAPLWNGTTTLSRPSR